MTIASIVLMLINGYKTYATVILAIDSADTLYSADPNDHVIRKYAADGQATVVSGTEGTDTEGDADGPASVARFGTLLTTGEIRLQYHRYNESEQQDQETQTLLASILDTIEARAAADQAE